MPHIDLIELPYFEGISLQVLVGFIDRLQPVQFSSGERIVSQGQTTPLYIATDGKVSITKQTDPLEPPTVLAELNSPTIFGEIELLCDLPAVASVEALSPVSAFILTKTTFDSLHKKRNEAMIQFVLNVARVACHRLALAEELMARYLKDDDVAKLREAIFVKFAKEANLSMTTGAFPALSNKD